jgi:hypothetical protein
MRTRKALVPLAALPLVLAGCGSPAAAASPSPTSARPAETHTGQSTAGSATHTASHTVSSHTVSSHTASESSAHASAVGRCTTAQLKGAVGRVDAGAGQRYTTLTLTNRSGRTCWVYGYVGLIMIDGHQDAMRTRVRRQSGAAHRITLKPGAAAHAKLHWVSVRSSGEKTCPASTRALVIPPDEKAFLNIPFGARPCDFGRIDVSPLT